MIQIPIEKIVLNADGTKLEIDKKLLEEAVGRDCGLDSDGNLTYVGGKGFEWTPGELKSVYGGLLAAERVPFNVRVSEEVEAELRRTISRTLKASKGPEGFDVWGHDLNLKTGEKYEFNFDFEPFDFTRYHSYEPRNERIRKVS